MLVTDESLKIAGDEFTADIMEYMSRQYNMKVGEKTAELIKINVGAATTSLPKDMGARRIHDTRTQ